MSRSFRILPLVGATLLIWSVRLRNLVTDPSSDVGALGVTVQWLTAGLFALGALFLASRLWAARATTPRRSDKGFVVVFAAVTVGYWMFRAIQIATADHPTSFVIVHSVLAGVLIVTSGLALSATRPNRAAGQDPVTSEARQFQSVE